MKLTIFVQHYQHHVNTQNYLCISATTKCSRIVKKHEVTPTVYLTDETSVQPEDDGDARVDKKFAGKR